MKLITFHLFCVMAISCSTLSDAAGLGVFKNEHNDRESPYVVPKYLSDIALTDLKAAPRVEVSSFYPSESYELDSTFFNISEESSSTINSTSSVSNSTSESTFEFSPEVVIETSTGLHLEDFNSTELLMFDFSTSDSYESSTEVSSESSEVVLGPIPPPTNVTTQKSIFKKSLEWVEDAYTLSIVMPIAAGVLFATTIIVVVALCRCCRRCCRRRKYRRRILPETVKNMKAADRARLLAETSDEEF